MGTCSMWACLCSCLTENKGLAPHSDQVLGPTVPGSLGAAVRVPGLGRDTQDEDRRPLPGTGLDSLLGNRCAKSSNQIIMSSPIAMHHSALLHGGPGVTLKRRALMTLIRLLDSPAV